MVFQYMDKVVDLEPIINVDIKLYSLDLIGKAFFSDLRKERAQESLMRRESPLQEPGSDMQGP